jgi:hypothetical protein
MHILFYNKIKGEGYPYNKNIFIMEHFFITERLVRYKKDDMTV